LRDKGKSPKPIAAPADNNQGITQAELCRRSGIDAKHISRSAKTRGLTSHQWLEKQTGWTYRDGKYYPAEQDQARDRSDSFVQNPAIEP